MKWQPLGWSVLAALLLTDALSAQVPPKSRQDIVRYAATGIGSPYVWGGGSWDPNDRSYGGADCSGFVSKCWSIPRWSPYRAEEHGPSTADFIQTPGSNWDEIDRGAMIYGDVIVFRYNNNSSGHTYVYLAGDGWGEHEVYEARGTDYGIVHRWRTALSSANVTKAIRRTGLTENVGVTEHIVESDDGAPWYTDVGMTGNSPYDSSAPGCSEGNCRYRWMAPARAEYCTFRPDLPEAGCYRLYVTCNTSSPNVHDVGVTVNHTLGAPRFLWDQADAAGLNAWLPIGGESFLFAAGSTGAVVWDDLQAWPTTSEYVFRGDASKFVLDNRVEVDGIGGADGRFATLRAALAWVKTRESEEPDIIRITCNTLIETACITVDLWDDVTIEGDADGDGVPVVIAVSPSTPADWARPCGMYLNVPIQRQYTLRDIVLVPAFVGAGSATGAYGLVIDEQNPSGQACATRVTLDNVTVAGSLAGNVPTDPLVNSRALATMFGGTDANYGAAVLQLTSSWAGDDGCRQAVEADGLTVTHSATRGLAVRAAYVDWTVRGLTATYCGLEGLRADHLGSGSTLTVEAAPGAGPNLILSNLAGGVVNYGDAGVGTLRLSNCVLRDNVGSLGGGVSSLYATTELTSCVIADNTSSGMGGGVQVVQGTATLRGCTIVENVAASTAGGVYAVAAGVAVVDSILWGNSPAQVSGPATVTYSNVGGGCAGTGNIALPPRFIDAAEGDYHLRRGSPGVNEGDPAYAPASGESDFDGEDRVQGGWVDMGADETPYWDGDADHDGDVDLDDLRTLADCLSGPGGTPAPPLPLTADDCRDLLDFDEDGDVDLADFAEWRLRP